MTMSRKSEKSTKPTDQLIQSVDTDTKLETEWRPMLENYNPEGIIREIDALIRDNRTIREELQELKQALEEKRGKLE